MITVKGVEKQLASLDPKKASGQDGIPPWFLKENASQIAPILTDIYKESISSGRLPIVSGKKLMFVQYLKQVKSVIRENIDRYL